MQNRPKLFVVGAGAWGTALAILANRAGNRVTLWTRNKLVHSAIEQQRINNIHLPSIFIDPAIGVTEQVSDVRGCDCVLLSVPSQHIRTATIGLADYVEPEMPIIISAKGIERGSLLLMSEVVRSVLPHNPIAVLSGPNFAAEAAEGLPTASSIACADVKLGTHLQQMMSGKNFRLYQTDDIIGVQVGGAIKNVIAIACGIAMGFGLGENARAALITRGLAEMARLTKAKGGKRETLMGLAGMGDLILTATSSTSRNFSFGLALGQGLPITEALNTRKFGVVEGVFSVESACGLAGKFGIELPICGTVRSIVTGAMDISNGINELLERPLTSE